MNAQQAVSVPWTCSQAACDSCEGWKTQRREKPGVEIDVEAWHIEAAAAGKGTIAASVACAGRNRAEVHTAAAGRGGRQHKDCDGQASGLEAAAHSTAAAQPVSAPVYMGLAS